MVAPAIDILRSALQEFCRKHQIRRLLLFGLVIRDDFRPENDIDILVEFDPRHVPGLIGLAGMELEFQASLDILWQTLQQDLQPLIRGL